MDAVDKVKKIIKASEDYHGKKHEWLIPRFY